jgi:hypothetical protein
MSCVFQQQDKSFNSSHFKKDLRLTPAGPTTLPLGFLLREGFFSRLGLFNNQGNRARVIVQHHCEHLINDLDGLFLSFYKKVKNSNNSSGPRELSQGKQGP